MSKATASIPNIHQAARAIRAGELTPIELLERCLARIERYEPKVKAFVFVDRELARDEAERLTGELEQGYYRGPLHGIPLGVKDIFDVFDWPTAAGSKRLANACARRDASVVARLRQAGAVFVGKTTTTQFASFDPAVTCNPWKHDRTPGGSSSGSAAGMACGMFLAALGSQTGGSITRPASYCGVYGLKPTYGRVSTDGVVELAISLDHIGPIGGCVSDLAYLLQVMAGPDWRDLRCSTNPVPDYLHEMQVGQAAPRLGRLRGLFEEHAEPPILEMMDAVEKKLSDRGAHWSAVAQPAGFSELIARHRVIMGVEAAAFHAQRLRSYPDDYQPKLRGLLEESLRCPAPEYARCLEHQKQLAQDVLACFEDVDALLVPAITGPAPDISGTGNLAFQAPWSYTGLPTVSFPAGWSKDGLPLCVQVVGRPWQEGKLLALAEWCDQALAVEKREPPS
ncbi:MAG: amidase [Gemmataceae bacterium]